MKISGEILTTQLTDLFQWIAHQRKTGCLSLTGEAADHTIYFSLGLVAGTKTTVGNIAEGETQARLILKDALQWKSGSFEFVEVSLPSMVAATNLQMEVSCFFDEFNAEVESQMESASSVSLTGAVRAPGIAARPAVAAATDVRSIIIDRVMTGKFKIPLLPTVATKVMQITRRDNYSLNDLSKVILTDQVIAANVLKQANSALFGGDRQVTTLPLAIQRIGSDTVTKLVFALSLQGIRSENDIFLEKKKKLWEYSSACALFARFLALPVRLDHNLAFLCGLMQDFGKIVLLSIIQEVVDKELKPNRLADETVEKILDTYHPMVGSMVGEKWSLPVQVIAAMAYHRSLSAKGDSLLYAAIANLSDLLVLRIGKFTDEEIANLTPEDMEVQVMAAELADAPANRVLGLSVDQLAGILARAQECMQSAKELMRP